MANRAQGNEKLVAAVGKAYRAGTLSHQVIADKYEVSRTTVRRWAKQFGWTRDLSADVRVTAKRKAMVQPDRLKKVQEVGESVNSIPDAEIVEDFSELGAVVLRDHRGLIGKLRTRIETLLANIEGHRLCVQQIADNQVVATAKTVEFIGDQLLKQTAMLRDLAQTMARLIPLERQAFSLDNRDDEQTYEQALKELYESEPEPVGPIGQIH